MARKGTKQARRMTAEMTVGQVPQKRSDTLRAVCIRHARKFAQQDAQQKRRAS